jgi:predicted small secreted protein
VSVVVRRRAFIAAVVMLGASLTGCSVFSGAGDEEVPDSGPVAYYPKASSELTDTAAGTLSVTAECVTLTAEDGNTVLPVFPVGQAAWDGTALTTGAQTIAAGEEIDLRGGYVDNGMIGPVTYVPAGCTYDRIFFVAAEKASASPSS